MLAFANIHQGSCQNIALRLAGTGDRISGTILSENGSEIILSNSWNNRLVVPVSQVQTRENPLPSPPLIAPTPPTKELHNAPPAPAAKPHELADKIAGELALGADFESGAKSHRDYNAHAQLVYAHPYRRDPREFFRTVATYDVRYGAAPTTLTENRMYGSSKTDLDMTRRYYAYNLGGAGFDEVRLIKIRYEDGPGFGYHWITRTNIQANLELGANYQVEERTDASRDESFFLRLGQDVNWKLTPQMTLTERFEYFPKEGQTTQFRLRFESTLSYALILNLSLNVTVADIYDTNPAQTVPENDFQLRSSLGMKF